MDAKKAALLAEIELANNGYLILSSMRPVDRELAIFMMRAGDVAMTNGLVHLPATKPEFFQTAYPVRAFPARYDGPDYKAMILNRQECDGFFD